MEIVLGLAIWLLVWLAPLIGLMLLGYRIMSAPLRRRERARSFLTLLDTALRDGQNVEQTLISISLTRDPGLGPRFYALAGMLRAGKPLGQALEATPGIVPPQVVAMLQAGAKVGDLHKVMPACRQLLKDNLNLTRGSVNYLLGAACITTPAAIAVFTFLQILVLPRLQDVAAGMDASDLGGLHFLAGMRGALMVLQVVLLLIVWTTAFVYIGGPAFSNFSWQHAGALFERLQLALPWRRHRMQRDFSNMLAILLDAGVPEPEALALAANCTANNVFKIRAKLAAAGLARGMKLAEAVQMLDDSGEFRWRIALALQSGGSFAKSIQGWTESLEAKATEEEQATASVIATGIVLLNGLFVGTIVVSVFSLIVGMINQAVLW